MVITEHVSVTRHYINSRSSVQAWRVLFSIFTILCVFFAGKAEAQGKTIRVLSKMSVRLQTNEHRIEVLHMLPPPVPEKRSE